MTKTTTADRRMGSQSEIIETIFLLRLVLNNFELVLHNKLHKFH